MLSVHMNVFDTGMVRTLRIASFKRVASTCSSSFGMENAFMSANLFFFQIGKQLEFRVKFLHGREEKLQHKKKEASELSKTCVINSTQSTGAVK